MPSDRKRRSGTKKDAPAADIAGLQGPYKRLRFFWTTTCIFWTAVYVDLSFG